MKGRSRNWTDPLEGVMDSERMLQECARLRGHVVAGLRESENVRRLLEGATGAEDVPGTANGSAEGGGQR